MAALDVNQTALAARHELARRGLRVFPLVSNSKRPAVDAWPTKASADPGAIEDLWAEAGQQDGGELNTAVATGQGLLVLDFDCKNGQQGLQSRFVLEAMGLSDTLEATTPTGGAHLYLRTPAHLVIPNSVGKIAPGVDVRGHHGYVVAPGSTINGVAYEWVDPDQPMADAPDWLIAMCADTGRERHVDHQEPLGPIDTPGALARGAEWLQTQAPEAIEGDHGDLTTFKVAARLKDFGIGLEKAHDLMAEHWDGVKSFPAWGDGLMAKVEAAFKSGRNRPGSANAAAQFGIVDLAESAETASGTDGPCFVRLADRLSDPKRKRSGYLVKGLLGANKISLSYGASNVGKSFVLLDLACHVQGGVEWAGRKVKQGLVVYVAAEGADEMYDRGEAIVKAKGMAPDIALVPWQPNLCSKKDLDGLLGLIASAESDFGQRAVLVIIDTLAEVFAGDENSSQDMGVFRKALRTLQRRTGAHIHAIHHEGKNGGKGARGHSSLRAAIDTEIRIEKGRISVTKQRGMKYAPPLAFRLREVDLGMDVDGDRITSCVTDFGAAVAFGPVAETMPTPERRLVYEALDRACAARRLEMDTDKVAFVSLDEIHAKVTEIARTPLFNSDFGDVPTRDATRMQVNRLVQSGHAEKGENNQYRVSTLEY